MTTHINPVDRLFETLDNARRTLFCPSVAARPMPQPTGTVNDDALTPEERALSCALMRVNHVGEVCAQALYTAQSLVSRDPAVRAQLAAASREETDHLAWTEQRLADLGGRTSWLKPVWWGGAFGIGLAAALVSDRVSLGFVVETERQVEAHLAEHLERLPPADTASQAVVAQMKLDEAAHADMALAAGGTELPSWVKSAMQRAAAVMTNTAHHL